MLAITIALLLAGKPTAAGAKGVAFCFTFAIKFQNRNIPLLIGAKYNYSIITTKCLRSLIENYGVIPTTTHTHTGQEDRGWCLHTRNCTFGWFSTHLSPQRAGPKTQMCLALNLCWYHGIESSKFYVQEEGRLETPQQSHSPQIQVK